MTHEAKAKEAFQSQDYELASNLYTQALGELGFATNAEKSFDSASKTEIATLLLNRSLTFSKLGRDALCYQDTITSLELSDHCAVVPTNDSTDSPSIAESSKSVYADHLVPLWGRFETHERETLDQILRIVSPQCGHGFLHQSGTSCSGTECSPDPSIDVECVEAVKILCRGKRYNFQKAFFRRASAELSLSKLLESCASWRVAHLLDPSLQATIEKLKESRVAFLQTCSGIYNWMHFLEHYLCPWNWSTVLNDKTAKKEEAQEAGGFAKGVAKGTGKGGGSSKEDDKPNTEFARCLTSFVNYVHPLVQKAEIPGKGRGLVIGLDSRNQKVQIPAGTLLCVERAFHVGKNNALRDKIESKLLSDECPLDARKQFWALSDGTAESEVLSRDCSAEGMADETLLGKILATNVHTCQIVDTYSTPVKVSTDLERSGVWLHSAFINHGCLPTVHRVVGDQFIIIRAARDLESGDELLDSYCELLRTRSERNAALNLWHFSSTGFREKLENLVIDENVVREKVQIFFGLQTAPEMDAACDEADAYCVKALCDFLTKNGNGPAARALWEELPSDFRMRFSSLFLVKRLGENQKEDSVACESQDVFLSSERFQEIRYGFAKPDTKLEEQTYEFQLDLVYLLLSNFGNIVRMLAYSVKESSSGHGSACKVVAQAFDRFYQILHRVLPNSELSTEIANETLSQEALANHLVLTNSAPIRLKIVETVALFGRVYCFGETADIHYQVWERFSKNLFSEDSRLQVKDVWTTACNNFVTSKSKGAAKSKKTSSNTTFSNTPEINQILERCRFGTMAFECIQTEVTKTLPSVVTPAPQPSKPAARSEFSFAKTQKASSASKSEKTASARLPKPSNESLQAEHVPTVKMQTHDVHGTDRQVVTTDPIKKPERPETSTVPGMVNTRPDAVREIPSSNPSSTRTDQKLSLDSRFETLNDGKTVKLRIENMERCPDVFADRDLLKINEGLVDLPPNLQGVDDFQVKYSSKKRQLVVVWQL